MTERYTTLGELADAIDELREEYGDDAPVKARIDGVVLPNTAISVEDGEIVFH